MDKRRKSEDLPGAISSSTTGSEGGQLAVEKISMSLTFSEGALNRGSKAQFEMNSKPPGHLLASGSIGDSEGVDSSAGAGMGSPIVGSGSGSVFWYEQSFLGTWWRN